MGQITHQRKQKLLLQNKSKAG